MLCYNGQLTVFSIVSLHATVLGELTSARRETRPWSRKVRFMYIWSSVCLRASWKSCVNKQKKHCLTKTTLGSCQSFCALFLQMHAFKNSNRRLLCGFLYVRRFDISVIVFMNDKYSMRLLCDCHQEVVLCLSFWPTTDKLRSRGGDLIARRLM